MAKKLYEEENIRDIACAIREKCGDESKTYKCCDMADAIRALAVAGGEYDIAVTANSDGTQTLAIVDASGSGGNSGGGGSAPAVIRALTITENGTYTVPAGVDGYNPVTVNIPSSGTPASGVEDYLIMGTLSGAYTNDRVTKVNGYAFTGLSSLTSISLPNVTTVNNYGFWRCGNNLISVDLPKATKIGDYSFYYCQGLTSLDLPKATSVGYQTFHYCSALATVILRSETMVTSTDSTVFKNTPIESGTGYIYVPSALVDTYKAHARWKTYANQFRALESYTVDGTITGALDATKI